MIETQKPRLSHIIVAIAALFLITACGGKAADLPLANVEMQSQSQVDDGQVENTETNSDQGADESETDVNLESAAGEEDPGSASEDEGAASVEFEQEEGYPALILGDPKLHASDPSSFTRASGRVQLLEFFAYWCPNCKRLAPHVHGLEKIYSDQVNFIYLDIDNPVNYGQMDAFGFYYQPLIILLDPNGIEIMSWVGGGIDPYELQEEIEAALQMIG